MVLADAMGYARRRLRPDVLVDVATLTGAATMALGRTHAAMYSTYPPLARALERAGETSGERVWEMPLTADYRPMIDSDVADVCQISTEPKNGAGSVMAALFLREFAGDVSRLRVGLLVEGAPARDGAPILDAAGAEIGRVTSGGFSPTLNRAIALGFVPPAFVAPGTHLAVSVRGRAQPAEVTTLPFVPHRYFRKPA